MTISSPSPGAVISVGAPLALSATATDAEDGDLTAQITWSSSIEGAISLTASGEAVLDVGEHVLTATVTDSRGEEGSAAVSVTVVETVGTHVVAEGSTLRLLSIQGGEIEELDSAQIPGVTRYQTIFSVVSHPTQPWLYTASMLNGLGMARLDRFVLAGDTLTHAGAAFSYLDSGAAAACIGRTSEYCAPVGMTFSSDGSRLYVGENDEGVLQIFSVDAAGDLTFITEGSRVSAHGLAFDPTGRYLYNGSRVIQVTDDVAVTLHSGIGGNSTSLVTLPSGHGLISTNHASGVRVYDLTDPELPVAIAQIDLGSPQAREVAFTEDLERLVTVGYNRVRTLSFDGATIGLADTYEVAYPYDVEFRGIGLSADGAYALAAWWSTDTGAPTLGGVELLAIAADGGLTLVDSANYDGPSRVVFTLP